VFRKQLAIKAAESSVIVVDATLPDFALQSGIFAQCYGEKDAQPVLALCKRMIEYKIEELRKRGAHVTLCRSNYDFDQFGVPGLESLCVTEQGRESLVDENKFDWQLEKTDNSILSAGERIHTLITLRKNLILAGVTTTSCVGKSIEDMRRQHAGRVQIIVPWDAVASRASQTAKEAKLLKQWEDSRDVIVVSELDDIIFE